MKSEYICMHCKTLNNEDDLNEGECPVCGFDVEEVDAQVLIKHLDDLVYAMQLSEKLPGARHSQWLRAVAILELISEII